MPISAPGKPPDPPPAALDANRRGIALRAQGRIAEAIRAFEDGIRAQPGIPELHANLATTLADAGDLAAAERAYAEAIRLDPGSLGANVGLGSLLVRGGRFDDARAVYERVLQIDAQDLHAHLALYELEQIAGNTSEALRHQRIALARQSLFSEYAPEERRRVLVLLAPGDWQANVPVDFLIDRRTTTLHKLYVISPEQIAHALIPAADAVFVAIGESDENVERLRLAETVLRRTGLPVINRPQRILGTNRVAVAKALAGLEHSVVPQTTRMERAQLEDPHASLELPIVIRPVGSQAGKELARINDAAELREYLAGSEAQTFYVMPFVDFSREDGYFRKYRIIIVDGVPYAYHLAISPRWMIHYYNAPMAENAWMREEEERFLNDFDAVFGPELQRALRQIAHILELEYVGVDCSIDRSGRLVVFEADPAMIVHAGDDPALFGYKIPAAQRVFAAFERLVDRVGSR